MRWVSVWRRNMLVWRKLLAASVLSNLADLTRFAAFLHDHNYAPTHTALRRAHIRAATF